MMTNTIILTLCLQQRDYDDDDYIAGVKGSRPADPRARVGGAAPGAPGGLVRSGSEMSLPAGGDQRLNKRMKSQLASKPSDAGRMDMHGRCVSSADGYPAWDCAWDRRKWLQRNCGGEVAHW